MLNSPCGLANACQALTVQEVIVKHELPALPYAIDALEPHLSRETLEYHHGKHHQAYVDKLNKLVGGTEYERMSVEKIIKRATGPIFNNAAQIFNHSFYWNCLTPGGGTSPPERLAAALSDSFGSVDTFKQEFTTKALAHFGSGWVWLVKGDGSQLRVEALSNAETPLEDDNLPLLTCDVWEHAYYIDYRNRRPDYVEAFWKLVNWEFVSVRYEG